MDSRLPGGFRRLIFSVGRFANKPMEMLIEHKLNFLDTMANIGMSWWVSGIVFCASILAGCWLKREVIVSIPFFHLFCITVTVFFLTVVGFGLFMSYHAACLEADVDTLLNTMQRSDPTSRADFRVVKYGYLIGVTSFSLITACWVALWCILAKHHRNAVRSSQSPAVSVSQHDS